MSIKIATCIAPVNIAVIKYWGKRDEKLILPINDSISGTLSTDHMCSKTTVAISPKFIKDQIWLNGVEESINNPRLQNCITEIKALAKLQGKMSDIQLSWKLKICSKNNFPTAAGLASSAAGYACLVYSLATLFEIEGDISKIARQGSGSACRSVYGGFVQWTMGTKVDGSDSFAVQIAKDNHWPEMRVLILVVSDTKKKTSSTSGMQKSIETSDLLKHRIQYIDSKIKNMTKAILEKDYETFAEMTMRESNQFHAICLDTYPTCVYMNDTSHAIADLMHQINKDAGKNIVSYTYDAGPNACLYLLEENVPLVMEAINHVFPTSNSTNEYFKGIPIKIDQNQNFPSVFKREPYGQDALRYIIHTNIGDGPKVLTSDNHLLNELGDPK